MAGCPWSAYADGSHIVPGVDALQCTNPSCSCQRERAIRTPVLDLDSPRAVCDDDDDSTVSYEDAVEDTHSALTPAPLAELGSLVGAPPLFNPTPAGSPDLQLQSMPDAHMDREALRDLWANIP
eukprot:15885430-Heterocapsa_arctica.AAC.1